MKMYPLKNRFDEAVIHTKIDEFTDNYSVNDIVPHQSSPGGLIKVNLFHGIQDHWEERQTRNKVPIHISTAEAIDSVDSSTETDRQAILQFVSNPGNPLQL